MARTFVPEEQQRAADITALKNTRPTANRVVIVDSDDDGQRNQFLWDPAGEASNADGTELVASSISEFADGGANEGVWKRIKVPMSVSDDGSSVLTSPTDINFGSNLSVTDDADGTISVDASASGGGTSIDVDDGGTDVNTGIDNLNFGTNLSVTDDGNGAVTINSTAGGGGSASITVEDGGTDVATGIDNIDFNDNLSVTDNTETESGEAIVDVPLGGSTEGVRQFNDGSNSLDALDGGLTYSSYNDLVMGSVPATFPPSSSQTDVLEITYTVGEFTILDSTSLMASFARLRFGRQEFSNFNSAEYNMGPWFKMNLKDGEQIAHTPADVQVPDDGNNEYTMTFRLDENSQAIGGVDSLRSTNGSFDISGQGSDFADVEMGDGGSKVYVLDRGNTEVDEYTLSNSNDITTASLVNSFDVSGQDATPEAVEIANDGSKLFVLGAGNNSVYEYTLGTEYDTSTATLNNTFDISGATTSPEDLNFMREGSVPAGSRMFVLDTDGNIHLWEFATGHDTSSTVENTSFNNDFGISNATGFRYADFGETIYITDASGTIYEFEGGFHKASPGSQSQRYSRDISETDSDIQGVTTGTVDNSATRFANLYILGNDGNALYQYSTDADVGIDLWQGYQDFNPNATTFFDVQRSTTIFTAGVSSPNIDPEDSVDPTTGEAISGAFARGDNGELGFGGGGMGGFGNGINTVTSDNAFAFGFNNRARGYSSIAIGEHSAAIGGVSFATGQNTVARGEYSASFGIRTRAEQNASFAIGRRTTAAQNYAFASGNGSLADGFGSFAHGAETVDNEETQPQAIERGSTVFGPNQSLGANAFVTGLDNIGRIHSGLVAGLYSEDYRDGDGGNVTGVLNFSDFNDDDRIFQIGVGDNPNAQSGDSSYYDGTARLDGLYVTYRNGTYIRQGLQIEDSGKNRVFDITEGGVMTLANGTGVSEISTSLNTSSPSDEVLLTEAAIEAELGSASVDVKDGGTLLQTASAFNFGSNLTVSTVSSNEVTIDASGGGGGGVNVSEDTTEVVSGATDINFGTGLGVTDDTDGTVTVNSDVRTGSATFSGDGSTTQFNIAHGLSDTPSEWSVQAITNDASGVSHVTADSTNLTVNYDTAPNSGTDNIELNYFLSIA